MMTEILFARADAPLTLATMTSAALAAIMTDETGTGALTFANSPVLINANMGTPSALALTNATGTPASITLTNGSGLPVATGISGLGAGIAAFLATPSSANLATAVTNETGSGALVFGTSPALTTPTLSGTTLTGTTTTTGHFASSYANPIVSLTDSGTSFAYQEIIGSGGGTPARFIIGTEGTSAGGNLMGSSTANASILTTVQANPLQFGTTNVLRGQFTSGGDWLVTQSMKSNSATAGVGYATGAGGTVTQATSKSTTVVLNKVSGAITLHNATLAAATIASFTLTNSAIAITDVIVLNHISGGTAGAYGLNAQAGNGSAAISVRNNTAGDLSEAIVLQFAVIKAVNT